MTKQDNVIEMNLLDFVRQDLEASALRGMAVLKPLKVVITNYDGSEILEALACAERYVGRRELPFGAEIFIEQDDFAVEPPPKWKRLSPGQMVRLRYAYIIRCDEVVEDDQGNVVQLNCTYFADSKVGKIPRVKTQGVVHWVEAQSGVPVRDGLWPTVQGTEPVLWCFWMTSIQDRRCAGRSRACDHQS